ncbi:septum formation initiator family protein [candidate division KSB1 bacterium]|nr:septum formation initiator family protein [candidate division KSB1 bacterium]
MNKLPFNFQKYTGKKNYQRWPFYIALIGLLFLLYAFLQGEHGLIHYWKLTREKNQIQTEIAQLKKDQEQLKQEIDLLLKNKHYIEKVAREKYKMGRNGEKVYVILDETEAP